MHEKGVVSVVNWILICDKVHYLLWDVHVSYVDIPTHQNVKGHIANAVQIQSI